MLIRVLRYRGRAPDTITEAEFSEAGGSIGRSSDCTLSLPDPERHVSRVQAEIRWEDGRFLLLGRGTANPIECNGEPLPAGQSAALSDGDELHIGDYVLRVEFQQTRTEVSPQRSSGFSVPGTDRLEADDSALFDTKPAPLHDRPASARTQPGTEATQLNISQRPVVAAALQERTLAHTGKAANSQEPYQVAATCPASTTGFRSWDSPEGTSQTVIVGKSEPGTATQRPAVPAAPAIASPDKLADLVNRAAQAHRRDFVPIPKSRTTGFLQELNRKVLDAKSSGDERSAEAAPELMQALLYGAGLPDFPLHALDEEMMLRVGALLRSFAQGFIDLLATRTAFKAEMRAEMTVISSEGNNPLKFSPDGAEALAHLLMARATRGYMKPDDAVQDAVSDLLAHQSGILAGMRVVLQEVLQRLSPEELNRRLSGRSMLDTMLPMNRKARLWELYEELHADVSRQAQDDIEAMFGREFVSAYEAQIKRLEAKGGR